MKFVENQIFDSERALYGSDGIIVKNCRFEGEADGESALKESRNIVAEGCFWNLRYPFWHDVNLEINKTEMTDKCRAALWYSENIKINDSKLHGIKALRECRGVSIHNCSVDSTEFGWFTNDVEMIDTTVKSEYFMMRSRDLSFKNVELNGKYSFQYIENSHFENCVFNTKDAFWHGKNIVVKNSVINGEYLAWYAENITFINCKISGTQPFCYCKGLKLINCEMSGADFAFEKSEVEAEITTPVISIKNPKSGYIKVPGVEELIIDDAESQCRIEIVE